MLSVNGKCYKGYQRNFTWNKELSHDQNKLLSYYDCWMYNCTLYETKQWGINVKLTYKTTATSKHGMWLLDAVMSYSISDAAVELC